MSPEQSFSSIKSDLLEAIKATGVHDINGNFLPSNADDIIFGVPVDNLNLDLGWVGLEIPEADEDDKGEKKPKGIRKGSVLNSGPLGAGLRDGAILAFRFRDGAEDGADMDKDEWDVILPSPGEVMFEAIKSNRGQPSFLDQDTESSSDGAIPTDED